MFNIEVERRGVVGYLYVSIPVKLIVGLAPPRKG